MRTFNEAMQAYLEGPADELFMSNIGPMMAEMQTNEHFLRIVDAAMDAFAKEPFLLKSILGAMFHAGLMVGTDMEKQELE